MTTTHTPASANPVLRVPPAAPAEAAAYFAAGLAFHADVSDVAAAFKAHREEGAELGFQVKEMLGGIEYWIREGFEVETWQGREQRAEVDPLTAPTDSDDCGC